MSHSHWYMSYRFAVNKSVLHMSLKKKILIKISKIKRATVLGDATVAPRVVNTVRDKK